MEPFVPALFIGGILMTYIVQFLKKKNISKVRRRLEYPGLIEKQKICFVYIKLWFKSLCMKKIVSVSVSLHCTILVFWLNCYAKI